MKRTTTTRFMQNLKETLTHKIIIIIMKKKDKIIAPKNTILLVPKKWNKIKNKKSAIISKKNEMENPKLS